MENKNNLRKSKIRKSIERTINTGNYENIRIVTDFEIEVEHKEVSDLLAKSDHINTLLLKDFKTTENQILTELGLQQKKAFVKNNIIEAESKKSDEELEKIFSNYDKLSQS